MPLAPSASSVACKLKHPPELSACSRSRSRPPGRGLAGGAAAQRLPQRCLGPAAGRRRPRRDWCGWGAALLPPARRGGRAPASRAVSTFRVSGPSAIHRPDPPAALPPACLQTQTTHCPAPPSGCPKRSARPPRPPCASSSTPCSATSSSRRAAARPLAAGSAARARRLPRAQAQPLGSPPCRRASRPRLWGRPRCCRRLPAAWRRSCWRCLWSRWGGLVCRPCPAASRCMALRWSRHAQRVSWEGAAAGAQVAPVSSARREHGVARRPPLAQLSCLGRPRRSTSGSSQTWPRWRCGVSSGGSRLSVDPRLRPPAAPAATAADAAGAVLPVRPAGGSNHWPAALTARAPHTPSWPCRGGCAAARPLRRAAAHSA